MGTTRVYGPVVRVVVFQLFASSSRKFRAVWSVRMSEGSFAHFLKGAPVLLARAEDEPHSQWLREAGTVALRARNAAEAHERIQDQRVRLFAAILDIDMPGADLESFLQAMPAYCALIVMSRSGNAQMLELVQAGTVTSSPQKPPKQISCSPSALQFPCAV